LILWDKGNTLIQESTLKVEFLFRKIRHINQDNYSWGAEAEASGNMNLARLKAVAATGVDYISVGALTHSVKAMDISMNIIA